MSEWDRLSEKLRDRENPVVFFDVAAGSAPIGKFKI